MRYCQIYDFRELGRITLRQYALLMKAVRLQKLDSERDIYMQAWTTQQAGATEKRGKKLVPYFKNFKAFFDYQKLEDEIRGREKKVIDQRQEQVLEKIAELNSTKGRGDK